MAITSTNDTTTLPLLQKATIIEIEHINSYQATPIRALLFLVVV